MATTVDVSIYASTLLGITEAGPSGARKIVTRSKRDRGPKTQHLAFWPAEAGSLDMPELVGTTEEKPLGGDVASLHRVTQIDAERKRRNGSPWTEVHFWTEDDDHDGAPRLTLTVFSR